MKKYRIVSWALISALSFAGCRMDAPNAVDREDAGVHSPEADRAPEAPLFSGRVHLVQLVFTVGGAEVCVPTSDMQVALNYVTRAAVPISRFAASLGPNSVTVDHNVIRFVVPPPGSGDETYKIDPVKKTVEYGNQDLWKWLDAAAAKNRWTKSDGIITLNPFARGVDNVEISLEAVHGEILDPDLAYYGMCHLYVDLKTNDPLVMSDPNDAFAGRLSHELAEMVNDPHLVGNPEVCDPSPGHDFFNEDGSYIESQQGPDGVPAGGYGFWINSPAVAADFFVPVSNEDGRLEVFYANSSDSVLHHSWQNEPEGWFGYMRHRLLDTEGTKAKRIAAARNADGRLEIFYIGTDDVLYHNWQTSSGGGWRGEYRLNPVTTKAKRIAVERNEDGRLELFYIGMDDVVYHDWQKSAGGDWFGGQKLSGNATAKEIAVGRNRDGRLELFYIGLDKAIYHDWQNAAKNGWFGVERLAGNTAAKQIAVGQNADGRLELFYVGGDDVIRHDWQTSSGGWSGGTALGTSSDTGKRIEVGSNQDGRLELFVIGMDDKVYHFRQSAPNSDWDAKEALLSQNGRGPAAVVAKKIGIARNRDGRLEVIYIGTDRILYHIWQMQPNGVTGWTGNTILFGQKPNRDQ